MFIRDYFKLVKLHNYVETNSNDVVIYKIIINPDNRVIKVPIDTYLTLL